MYEYDYGNGHVIGLNGAGSGYPSDAWVNCPFASYDSKQGGVYPVVRYLGLYHSSASPGWPVVDRVSVWNGCNLIQTIYFSPSLSHSGGECAVDVIDLGAYYRFNRGLMMCVHITNGAGSQSSIMIGGYGARFEW